MEDINGGGVNDNINVDSGNSHGRRLHIVMFPFLAFGHISPFIQLSRKLIAVDPTTHITFLTTPANVPRVASLFLPPSPSITIHSLPLPPVPGLPPGAESTADLTMAQAELLKTAVDAMKPDVEALLSRLRPHFVVFDFAMPWIPSVATPIGIRTLFFTVFAAISNAYLTVPSRRPLGGSNPPNLHDLKKPPPGFPATSAIAVAGGVPTYQAQDFMYIFKTFGNGEPSVYDRFTACLSSCTAVISKTCREMEGQYISYCESEYKKPMLLAGPVVPEPPSGELEERWDGWLDKFEQGSVIYCSFGSETLLKDEAIKELLLGLEMTGLPFFVVLNCPEGEEEMRRKVPEGLESCRERGVIHWGWVQQQLILRHRSVGCYVNHGGFSSVVEGLVAGCQLVMLPQRGDQYLNSALFAGDLEIGVEVRREDQATGDFTREAVREAVKEVMMGVDGDQQQGGRSWERMKENQKKWREFLMDKGMEERFMVELVQRLKALATSS